jgi:hypothetical protein
LNRDASLTSAGGRRFTWIAGVQPFFGLDNSESGSKGETAFNPKQFLTTQ